MNGALVDDHSNLILAAEECPPERFDSLHKFSHHDQLIMRKLIAHGPVLLRGGRGSGKSALMLAAAREMAPGAVDSPALGVYLSLRYLPLLRTKGEEYERFFLQVLVATLKDYAARCEEEFDAEPNIISVQRALTRLSATLGKRIVLLFDDAAHIGREASLQEFFDLFRTLSSSTTSCKAAIYPGVTRFGTRFDVYNDATTVDVVRNADDPGFDRLFEDVALARFEDAAHRIGFTRSTNSRQFYGFLGRCVLGNMRAFVFAMNAVGRVREGGEQAGLALLTSVMKDIAANYYWPLLDELKPKLGVYETMIEPALEMAEQIFGKSGAASRINAVIHRELTAKFSKPLEILEYAGFIVRRDASIAMKSGGRGSRFALNLCNVLERIPGARLTQELQSTWLSDSDEPVEFHRSSPEFSAIRMPSSREEKELGILEMSIDHLKRSIVYPYGLTESKIELLTTAGYSTIGALAEASKEQLMQLDTIGSVMAERIRIVAQQAIWM